MLKNALLLTAIASLLWSCDAFHRENLKGVYQRAGGNDSFSVNKFEVTDSKFIMESMMGEIATEYKIEDGYLYAGAEGAQMRFKIHSPDTLVNENNPVIRGTFIKVN